MIIQYCNSLRCCSEDSGFSPLALHQLAPVSLRGPTLSQEFHFLGPQEFPNHLIYFLHNPGMNHFFKELCLVSPTGEIILRNQLWAPGTIFGTLAGPLGEACAHSCTHIHINIHSNLSVHVNHVYPSTPIPFLHQNSTS